MSCPRKGKTSQISGERTDETAAVDEPATVARRLDVSGTQVCASTLASVSAAVVASVFGTTGTIVGAALMSVITTAGGALYGHGIRRTGERLQETSVADVTRRLGPWPRAGDDPTVAAAGDQESATTVGPPTASGPDSGWRQWLAQRRWGVALGMAIVFAATLGIVTLIELAGQRSLADITGGDEGRTSIGSVFDGSSGDEPTPADSDTSTTIAPGSDPAEGDPEAPADVEPGDSDAPDDTTTDSTAPDTGEEEPPPATEPAAGADG